jgi:hypothetical protein
MSDLSPLSRVERTSSARSEYFRFGPKCDIPSHSPDARGCPNLRWRESNGEAVSEFDCFVDGHLQGVIRILLVFTRDQMIER